MTPPLSKLQSEIDQLKFREEVNARGHDYLLRQHWALMDTAEEVYERRREELGEVAKRVLFRLKG